MEIINSIERRRSCRTFTNENLTVSDREELEKFIKSNNKGLNDKVVDFTLLEKGDSNVQMKIPYGLIRGNKTYIFGKIPPTKAERINYGYMLEKIVLKATERNIATCWVAMFDREYFSEIQIENDLSVPCIIIIGYAEEKTSIKEKLIRKAIKADKRKPWESLFFNYETKEPLYAKDIITYAETLSMTRLAPSSGNTQPWRIFYNSATEEFHFFKKVINQNYELKGVHDIDMGIAMSHFELVSKGNGLNGSWQNQESTIQSIEDLQYIITWKCEQKQ